MSETGFLGIDCGGTNCRVAYAKAGRRVDYIGNGANFTTDPDGCAEAIVEACQGLADKAGIALSELCDAYAYLGVAGIVTDIDAAALSRALPFRRCKVEDDRSAMAVGALGDKDGFVVGLGTGSFVLRRAGLRIDGIGGWGLILGDEASAAWLGRGLLSRSLQAQDGLLPHTALTRAILDEFGGAAAIVRFARTAHPREFGRLAKGLSGAAVAGDGTAKALMQEGATWIGRGLRALGWQAGGRVVLPGDLGAAYVPFLRDEVQGCVTPANGPAVEGALALARQHASA
ncbi:BadF/BadG/BcrA/BcrD ATPase family protein [Pseudoprimorskyibacter insulae]|uniref:Glucosamine kinase GspK n=1 Tax=Pseudoprimorskyibacter insulae TaxID=1695997 RepID=A0A2R8AR35_9RHOB|nr:BadF/BadG/BcrA/BcrD ATPase family protein [Pseudoprimorskyibacter insulae]SPF78512.1 Glucosamine kinase GspK [Pseudoprimorskyibacter insulae]